jgi:NitT/TauT family transport system substrate-binding protein
MLTKATSSIRSFKDLAGKKIGAPGGGASLKMLPLMAKKNNIDYATMDILQVAPSLQEQMLLQGQVDAIAIFTATSYMNLVAMKLDPDKDFRWLYYADYGADLYSNCIIVSQKLAKEKPEAVKGLVRAINRSIKEVMADPDAAIEVLAKRESLINKDIEKRRLIYVYKTLMDTPEARELGMGDVNEARMSASAATIAESFELPAVPKFTDVFNRAFLPPKAERMQPVLAN